MELLTLLNYFLTATKNLLAEKIIFARKNIFFGRKNLWSKKFSRKNLSEKIYFLAEKSVVEKI